MQLHFDTNICGGTVWSLKHGSFSASPKSYGPKLLNFFFKRLFGMKGSPRRNNKGVDGVIRDTGRYLLVSCFSQGRPSSGRTWLTLCSWWWYFSTDWELSLEKENKKPCLKTLAYDTVVTGDVCLDDYKIHLVVTFPKTFQTFCCCYNSVSIVSPSVARFEAM